MLFRNLNRLIKNYKHLITIWNNLNYLPNSDEIFFFENNLFCCPYFCEKSHIQFPSMESCSLSYVQCRHQNKDQTLFCRSSSTHLLSLQMGHTEIISLLQIVKLFFLSFIISFSYLEVNHGGVQLMSWCILSFISSKRQISYSLKR